MNSLKPYHDLEIDAHVSLDDVLSKTTQEMGELLTAIRDNNEPETAKESADLLINILSASSHVGIDYSLDNDGKKADEESENRAQNLPIILAEWHREVAAVRWKYSRDMPDDKKLTELTQRLTHHLLPLTQLATIEAVVKKCTEKFQSRVSAYVPDIDLRDYIQAHPDFPQSWIVFQDISPLLACPRAMQFACFELAKRAKNADIIAGLDARGFLFGIPVAQILNKPFVMIRKKWKLPGKTVGTSYSLEYGESSIELQEWAITLWQKVVIIDDLLATGGTLLAAASLIEKVGGKVDGVLSLIWLDSLREHPLRQQLHAYRNESVLSL
jgi:adenine phosphoribosyltransferase